MVIGIKVNTIHIFYFLRRMLFDKKVKDYSKDWVRLSEQEHQANAGILMIYLDLITRNSIHLKLAILVKRKNILKQNNMYESFLKNN